MLTIETPNSPYETNPLLSGEMQDTEIARQLQKTVHDHYTPSFPPCGEIVYTNIYDFPCHWCCHYNTAQVGTGFIFNMHIMLLLKQILKILPEEKFVLRCQKTLGPENRNPSLLAEASVIK